MKVNNKFDVVFLFHFVIILAYMKSAVTLSKIVVVGFSCVLILCLYDGSYLEM